MAAKAMPSHNGPPKGGSAGSEAPSASLYVKNLPDKLQKADLRMSVYMLFATYGPILDVVAMKTNKMRGQAHVVFRDIQASTQAMRALQGFDFYGKKLSIQYAKGRSDVFTKLEGVYRPPNAPAAAADEGQASIFTAPSVTAPTGSAPPAALQAPEGAANGTKTDETDAKGVKRRRDDDESDEEEAPMEEDDDDDVSMEASSDEED